jgi:cytochrome P450
MTPPEFSIDPVAFWRDPYPALAQMRATAPVVFVPELGAILMTRRDDIFECEKNTEVFSSEQPAGLMDQLMGTNMMRKSGDAHMTERKQAFPALSPRTVRDTWTAQFQADTDHVIADLLRRKTCDLVTDFAMPVSAHALRYVTGLTNLTAAEMDAVSQAMIDGIANYSGDPATKARCNAATARIDAAIDERRPGVIANPDTSLLSVLLAAEQEMSSIRANIKLAISGGQNEPRDAIAGAAWALLTHSTHRDAAQTGTISWLQVFEEFARWVSPIGMSPRRVAQPFSWQGYDLTPESRLFFMFSSGNRDERLFDHPEVFDPTRDTAKTISFGAGPHFCAGAAVSRVLIAGVALPSLFAAFPKMSLSDTVKFGGWAFRGPLSVPVRLT